MHSRFFPITTFGFYTGGFLAVNVSGFHLHSHIETEAVKKEERFPVFNVYLRKAAEIYGVTRTRQIYEKAIEVLEDAEAREMCMR